MTDRSVRWAFPLAAGAITLGVCAADYSRLNSQIVEARQVLASKMNEAVPLRSRIGEVHDYQALKNRLEKRLNVIQRVESERTTSYQALVAAVPLPAEHIRTVLLTANGDDFHIAANAPQEADVDAYLRRVASLGTVRVERSTRTQNAFHDFALHGRLRR